MGNICLCYNKENITKVDENSSLIEREGRFGVCEFCDKSRVCYFNPGGLFYNGDDGMLICLDCDLELNRQVLYE